MDAQPLTVNRVPPYDGPAGTKVRVPRFSMVGVVIVGALLHLMLTIFLMVFIWLKDAGLQAMSASGDGGLNPRTVELSLRSFLAFTLQAPASMGPFVGLARWIAVLSLLAILLGHVPIHVLLRLRRNGSNVPDRLQAKVETLALRSAAGTAALWLLASAGDVTARILSIPHGNEVIHGLAIRSIPFQAVVVLLVTSFIYYWQNHRIRTTFAPFIFTRPGFVQASRKLRRKTILVQMTLSRLITTVLPVCLVTLYLLTCASSLDLRDVTPEQRGLILGQIAPLYRILGASPVLPPSGNFMVPYLSAADTLLFICGIGTAFGITLVMLIFISRWSTLAIVVPLRELQHNVMRATLGDFTHETPVRDTDEIGELTENFNGMLASLRESDRMRIEKEAAVAASRAKSSFLANMSHELRTPLNAILGFAQILGRGANLDAEQVENVRIITRSGSHLLSLINDILDMSRIEAGRAEVNPQPFDVRETLGGLEQMFRLRAEEKGLSLIFDVAPEVPRHVTTDEGKLRQVLVNLLGNALKFTREGGATVRVRSRPEDDHSVRLLFEVEDSGVGIPAAKIDGVFEPFVQSRAAAAQEGTGLGLAISRTYVSLMGGSISVRSIEGEGSLFTFDVRAGLADAAQVAPARRPRRVVGLVPGQPTFRLIVADDRDSNRDLVVKLLAPLGFEVRGVRNGAECLSLWEEWKPQLIWMDMRMPVMDGYEATRRIKASARGQATVVIALTASVFESDRRLILSEGCDDFVRKPFVESEIYEKLEKHLGVRFVTEEDQIAARRSTALALTPELLSRVPAGWRDGFRAAAVAADYAVMQRMTDEIRSTHPTVADAMGALLTGFEYEKMLSALDGLDGGSPVEPAPAPSSDDEEVAR